MRHATPRTILLASVLLAAAFVGGAAAQCEYPLFIQQGATDANVLIIFDNSGSMNEVVWHDAFDPNVQYSGTFDTWSMYYVGSPGWYSPRSWNKKWPSSPVAYLVNSDGGHWGRYWGNYLNWVYYHATPAQRDSIPDFTRIQVAKPAIISVIQSNPNLRFGLMTFDFDHGPTGPRAPLGSDPTTLINTINNIYGDSWTPTAETMVSAAEYFKNDPNAIQYDCQKSFIVLVTDGLPTKDVNMPPYIDDFDGDGNDPGTCTSIGAPYGDWADCSDWMDDVAWYLRNTDMRPDLPGNQYVSTYAIGFNIDGNILQNTADNGDGLYISVNTPGELVASLNGVLRDIVNRISSGSAVAVVSTEGQTQDLLFRGKFMPNSWQGFLEAFELPYDPLAPPVWEAGALLEVRDPATRNLFTSVGGTMIPFDPSQRSYLRPYLGVPTDQEAQEIIEWTQGVDMFGYRVRLDWKLGDIIDSSPLVVGPPVGFRTHDNYLTWRQSLANRPRVIYIGANDGMIHCFDEQTGEELWGYIPEACLGRLKDLADLTYCHQYFMNLTPKVFDAFVGGQWRTMLVAGQKQGGDAYVALDVTDPAAPTVMWENHLPDIQETWSQPEPARPVNLAGQEIAFVGSGPDPSTGRAWLKAFDLETGAEVYSRLLSDNGGTDLNMATGPRAVDVDYDGWTDYVYVADMTGALWRLDLTVDPWVIYKVFQSDPNQPIQAQPIVTLDYNGDVFLYFGTGRYVTNADILDTSQQTFYCVIDKRDGYMATRYDMVDETSTIVQVGPTDRGWYIDLVQAPGERVVEPDALVAGFVYFTSFVPNADVCSAGGYSWFYEVNFRNGSADDGDDNPANDTVTGRVHDLGDGVATKPVVDVVNEDVIVQGSDTRIHVNDAAGTIRQLVVRSWRQRYD